MFPVGTSSKVSIRRYPLLARQGVLGGDCKVVRVGSMLRERGSDTGEKPDHTENVLITHLTGPSSEGRCEQQNRKRACLGREWNKNFSPSFQFPFLKSSAHCRSSLLISLMSQDWGLSTMPGTVFQTVRISLTGET